MYIPTGFTNWDISINITPHNLIAVMSVKSIAKKFSALFNFNASVRLNGKTYIVPIIKNIGFANTKLKEDWFFNLLKQLPIQPDATFVDIGVNVGQTMLTFKSQYNSAYLGFEPNPNCVFYVNTLLEVNKISNASVIPVGLSASDSIGRFFLKNSTDSAATTVQDLRPDYYDSNTVTYVPLFNFDRLRPAFIKKIAAIKIDVEGAELEVISGMVETLKTVRPTVICEVLDSHNQQSLANSQQRATRLATLVKECGYRIYRILHPNATRIHLEPIDTIQLRVWNDESYNLNDYIFAPQELPAESILKH
ncbi:MAG: FkbM family methyltransferase [Sphingobacteriales bacterium]|nr:MAG: FkbM family methyltransferase [Sphingobacteriales bacterium]